MALTEAQLDAKVDALNVIIDAALTTAGIAAQDYKIGDIEVKKGTSMATLETQRDYYLRELRLLQASGGEPILTTDYEISPFGEDLGQEVDED